MTKSIFSDDFNNDESREAQKLLDYYEDDQVRYVHALLWKKRKEWEERGFNIQTRNVVKSIIDKSGLLFNRPPNLLVRPHGEREGKVDARLMEILDRSSWLEFFQNVDVYTRLLKTTVVLQQKYIPTERSTVGGKYRYDAQKGDRLMLTHLHPNRTVVRTDVTGERITELAYLTRPYSFFGEWEYRYINDDVIEDWEVKGGKERRINSVPNPDGFVPASPFYDVRKPRTGFWFNMPEDLVSFQDNVNLFSCDLQYAVAHQMQKSLFMDRDIESTSEARGSAAPAAPKGEVWTPPVAKSKSIGGLGSIVKLSPGMAGSTPMVEFKGPDTDLKPLYEIVAMQVRDIAADWNVNVKFVGESAENSGFQVITKEKDNLALREQRAQSFQAGLRRFYEITQRLYPELQEGELVAEFAPPSLPVNRLEEEQVRQYRLQNGVETVIDVWMQEGMTEQEAMARLKRNLEIQKLMAEAATPAVAPAKPVNASQNGGNPRDPGNTDNAPTK